MRFNLSASVKHVAQLLNPDLEIPNAPTSSQPPIPSSHVSSSSSAEPSTRSRGNTHSLRSSLSTRRKRRTADVIYTPPPTSTTSEDTGLTSIQADYAASTNRDPTLRFYNPVQQTPVPQQQQRPNKQKQQQQPQSNRLSWKRRSANTTETTKTPNKMSNLSKKRSSWNGFQSTPAQTTSITTTPVTATAPSATNTNTATAPPTETPSKHSSHKSEPYFPLAGLARDGYSNPTSATATCFCGSVQLAFPVEGPGLMTTFVCHCSDCRKITASMFAANFTVKDDYLTHLRGRSNLSTFSQSTTIASGHTMTNYFCSTCGTLMYRVGSAFPGCSILRMGTVDDFRLVETKLKPRYEIFVKERVGWLRGG